MTTVAATGVVFSTHDKAVFYANAFRSRETYKSRTTYHDDSITQTIVIPPFAVGGPLYTFIETPAAAGRK